MKLFIVLLTFYLNLIQIIHSKKNRVICSDEFYHYELDKSVTQYKEIFAYDNLFWEQIDDDTVRLGGYVELKKSLDQKLPVQMDLRTQYLDHGIWNEGGMRLTEKNMCPELLNPARFWYNVTKLWTECPPQKGNKYIIQDQFVNMQLDLPPNVQSALWKWHFLITQGPPGLEKHKFGFDLHLQFVPI